MTPPGPGRDAKSGDAVYFSSPTGEASLSGREYHRLRSMLHDLATGILVVRSVQGRERIEELTGTEAPEGFSFQRWAIEMEDRLTGAYTPGVTWRGVELTKLGLVVNTALAAGGNPVRLAARIIAQVDDHCWVEGPDRAWLAGIITKGLETGMLATRFSARRCPVGAGRVG